MRPLESMWSSLWDSRERNEVTQREKTAHMVVLILPWGCNASLWCTLQIVFPIAYWPKQCRLLEKNILSSLSELFLKNSLFLKGQGLWGGDSYTGLPHSLDGCHLVIKWGNSSSHKTGWQPHRQTQLTIQSLPARKSRLSDVDPDNTSLFSHLPRLILCHHGGGGFVFGRCLT